LANKAEADKVLSDPVVNELMISEDSGVGEIPWSLYKSYIDFNGGTLFTVAILVIKFCWLFLNTIFNIWLTYWTEDSFDKDDHFYINWYVAIGVAYGVFAFFRALAFTFSNVRMSKHMHKEMISNLLFSSLNEFFDRVPLGRILNRLSKDMNAVDSNFPSVSGNVLVFMFFLLGNTIIVVYCSTIWVLFPILIYMICCYFLKNYYMKPQRELVRLESISKSPIISCFTEILNGVATIRAYGK
jgi:ABC-type multidrug transport system fused ATPase/permease subunit